MKSRWGKSVCTHLIYQSLCQCKSWVFTLGRLSISPRAQFHPGNDLGHSPINVTHNYEHSPGLSVRRPASNQKITRPLKTVEEF